MNEVIKTIYRRRAVRKYKDAPVGRELIEQVIAAGRMAPSALNRQPWRFYVLTDKDSIRKLSKETATASAKGILKMGLLEIARSAWSLVHFPHDVSFFKEGDFVFHGAPVVIFIATETEDDWASLDTGMCVQNMMLAASSLGLDSCPIGLARYVTGTKSYPHLGIRKTEQVELALIIGYGDENPEMKERDHHQTVFVDRFPDV